MIVEGECEFKRGLSVFKLQDTTGSAYVDVNGPVETKVCKWKTRNVIQYIVSQLVVEWNKDSSLIVMRINQSM